MKKNGLAILLCESGTGCSNDTSVPADCPYIPLPCFEGGGDNMHKVPNATMIENSSTACVLSQIPVSRKTSARIGLVNLPDAARTVLTECFRQFGGEVVLLQGDAVTRLKKEKFEACAVTLAPGAEIVLEAARTSPSNSRMVIYGL